MIKKKRYHLSGIFLALSSMLVIFPIVFYSGILIKSIKNVIKKQRIKPIHKKFHISFFITLSLTFFLSLSYGHSFKNWTSFKEKITPLNEQLTYSRIGFKYLFLFRGEVMESDEDYGYDRKANEFKDIKPFFFIISAILIINTFYIASRKKDLTATLLCGFSLLFILFGTVVYYYICLPLIILIWASGYEKPLNKINIAIFFLLMVSLYIGWEITRSYKFVQNSLLSLFILIYITYVYLTFIHKPRKKMKLQKTYKKNLSE
jgi:hypothetical protein